VISGPGTLDVLPAELDRYGCRRAVIVTGATLGASPLVDRVRSLLGARSVSVFTGARQHVPASTVHALAGVVRESDADALVSVGGGSPIDTAKGVVHAILAHGERSGAIPIHIAVPTTLSAGEFTDVAGITDDETRIKHAVYHTRLAPRTVVADPEVTRQTPSWLWAASGVRALDHAVETLYARRRHPISEPLAERAIRMLVTHLPLSVTDDGDAALDHRGACQMAAWLAVFGVTNAGFGLSHVLGHQIGPRWDVPHGITSAIVLPHVMRFMAGIAGDRFGPIARGLDVAFDPSAARAGANACADRVAAEVARLGLPGRLREVAVPRNELDSVAAVVAGLMDRASVVDGPVGREALARILEAAY
jgi:alcohol dehydrogenase